MLTCAATQGGTGWASHAPFARGAAAGSSGRPRPAAAAACAAARPGQDGPAPAGGDTHPLALSRRSATGAALAACLLSLSARPAAADAVASDGSSSSLPEVTGRIFLDFSTCEQAIPPSQRGLGEKRLCEEYTPLGRVVIGLYGKLVPATVANFITLVEAPQGGYAGTVVNAIQAGQCIVFGRTGQGRLGELEAGLVPLERNADVTSSAAFRQTHSRGGVVSLAITGGSDAGAASTEIAITTGPGPAPELDGTHIVFGRVLEGMPVIAAISQQPVFGQNVAGVIRSYNALAGQLGDDRAARAQAAWTRPVGPIILTACGKLD